jgi:hypothetical protein
MVNEGDKVTAYKTDLDRLASYERALDASRLIRTKEFYEATEDLARFAHREGSEDKFYELCKTAGIEDPKLVAHMWTIIKACAYSKGRNYLAENPGPLW